MGVIQLHKEKMHVKTRIKFSNIFFYSILSPTNEL